MKLHHCLLTYILIRLYSNTIKLKKKKTTPALRSSIRGESTMQKITYITSESVTEGHPDKICDQISDAILDTLIVQDPRSRVAVECLTTTGLIIVAGEVTTKGYADIQGIARRLAEVRKQGIIQGLGPDGKSQVSVEYHDGTPKRISAIVIAQQHTEDVSEEQLKSDILEKVVKYVCGSFMA